MLHGIGSTAFSIMRMVGWGFFLYCSRLEYQQAEMMACECSVEAFHDMYSIRQLAFSNASIGMNFRLIITLQLSSPQGRADALLFQPFSLIRGDKTL